MKYGAIPSGYDARDYKLVYTTTTANFPIEFELNMRAIKNQGSVGSCVAHALASIIEYYNHTQIGSDVPMSVGYIYGNRTTSLYRGEGMVVRDALAAVRKYGDVEHSLFPYNKEVPLAIQLFKEQVDGLFEKGYPNRISQYTRVTNKNAIKSAIMAGNPVLILITWYSDMKVVDDVLITNYTGDVGGHCMVIYGWDERGWKVQNSWGNNWGNNGCVIIPYDFKIDECWIVSDNIIDNTEVKKPFSSKLGQIIAKIINKIVNLFKKK